MNTYYKIVRNIDGHLLSYNGMRKTLSVDNRRYIPNKWTVANPYMFDKGFGLAVFDTLKNLKRFEERTHTRYYHGHEDLHCPLEVWRCKIIIPVGWISSLTKFDTHIRHIKDLDELIRFSYKNDWPSGTVLVQKVMLTKRIE